MSSIFSRRKEKVKIDECIFWSFECLGKLCVEEGGMRDKTRREYIKSISVLDYIVRNWNDAKERYEKGKSKKDIYVDFRFPGIYEKIMGNLKHVCESYRNQKYKKALNGISKCRAKLVWANSRVEKNLKHVIGKNNVISNLEELSNFISGERVSYKLFDVSDGKIENTLSELDIIFSESILNRGSGRPEVNTGKNWELCACGGGGFFVKREYLKPLDPKLPPGTSIEVEECPACDQDAGVRGLREKKHSSAPNRSQHPSYREHIEESFDGEQFHPDML